MDGGQMTDNDVPLLHIVLFILGFILVCSLLGGSSDGGSYSGYEENDQPRHQLGSPYQY